MKLFFRILIVVVILIPVIFLASYKKAVKDPVGIVEGSLVFKVNKGDGVNAVASNLHRAGLISSEFYFKLYVWREKKEGNLQAGEYSFSGDMSIEDIVFAISNGKTLSKEKTIKIIEGWNIEEINDYLLEEAVSGDESFLSLAKKPASNWYSLYNRYNFLENAPHGVDLEGFLFPDTYNIFNEATNRDVLLKMLDNFGDKLSNELKNEIERQGKTIFEIITMASIIQKEVRSEDDMKIVSGIFWNRINSDQALQSCATLAYILGENKPQYTIDDTETISPYNTYQNKGLPPGPISNPGLSAIIAAIYPTKTNYFYFLSSFSDGKTVFSETYEEHLQNKAKYLK